MNKDEIKDFGTRKTGFTVPDGYFADFDKRINALIDADSESVSESHLTQHTTVNIESEGESTPKVSLYSQVKPWLYMAATFISFVVFFKIFFAPDRSNSMMAEYQEDTTAVEDVIYSSVNDYDIFEYLYAENEY